MWTRLEIALCLIDLETQNTFLYHQLKENPFSYRAKEQFRSWVGREDINPVLKVLYEITQHEYCNSKDSYKEMAAFS